MTASRKDHLDATAAITLLVCCLLWGLQQTLVKATLAELPPVFQAAARFVGATVLLLLWCRWRGIPLFERDGTLWPGLLAGALFAGEFAIYFIGLQYTAASRLTLFLYTSPFWVALVLPFLVRAERLRPLQWAGLVLAFVGLAFALRESLVAPHTEGQLLGDALALIAGLAWGLTTVVIRSTKLSRVAAEKLLFYQVGVSAVFLPLLSLALGEVWVWHMSTFAMTSLAVQMVVVAFLTYLAWMWLLGRYPATKISAFSFLTPLFAMGAGAILLGEPITTSLIVALVLVTAGLTLVNRRA